MARRTAERSIWERRSTCFAKSEQSCLKDSASWADFMTRSASKIGRESSSCTVFSSTTRGGTVEEEVTVAVEADDIFVNWIGQSSSCNLVLTSIRTI